LFIFVLWHTLSNGKTGEKDNFHNLFFGLTKNPISISLKPTILKDFLFPKGVVDGERPLKFPKLIFWIPLQNLDLHLYLTSSKDILKAFHKNKYRPEFNPDPDR
jgi:hypothetical protein